MRQKKYIFCISRRPKKNAASLCAATAAPVATKKTVSEASEAVF